MSSTESLFLALLIVFAAPYLVWRLLRLGDLAPLVVVQIVGGVLLGPGVLGAWRPQTYAFVFTAQTVGSLGAIGSWAVTLFVWLAGLELDVGEAWAKRGETGLTAGLALGAPLVLGSGAAALMLLQPGWRGPQGAAWQTTLGIGMACAVTALPILVLLLERLEIMGHPFGQRVLRYASLDDVAIWAVLAIIICDWSRVGRQIGFIILFALACPVMRGLLRRLPPQDRWPAGLIWLLVCAWSADASGLHFMVGAFLSGAVLDKSTFEERQVERARSVVLLVFMPVFFLSTGLRTRWGLGGAQVFGAAALLLAASIGGKLAGVGLAGRLLGWAKGEASVIGWLLQTKALIMIIFVNILLDKGIVSADAFTALLLMAVASTVLTIPVVRPRLRSLTAISGLSRPAQAG
jgi:Kef-type K+ transport system membrane component KefB